MIIDRTSVTGIEALGAEKKARVNSLLLSGTNAVQIARALHSWGNFLKINEVKLARMLVSYRNKHFGSVTVGTNEGRLVIIGTMQEEKFDALKELQILAERQRNRVAALLDAEVSDGKHHGRVTMEVQALSYLLKDVLKAEFDCGVREFKGATSNTRGQQAVPPTHDLIEGTLTQATTRALEILNRNREKLIKDAIIVDP